jgi:hypothetical protein
VPVDASNEGAEGKEWNLQGRTSPSTVSRVRERPPAALGVHGALDRQDGALDGKWRDNSIAQFEEGWATPARIPYQGAWSRRSSSARGSAPTTRPTCCSSTQGDRPHQPPVQRQQPRDVDTLSWQDEDLGRFVDFLNQQVGTGRYVLIVTADHGAQFDPRSPARSS